jgi:hypothetical protein
MRIGYGCRGDGIHRRAPFSPTVAQRIPLSHSFNLYNPPPLALSN